MILDGLEATDRANKAALLLAHERYTAQYAPFVKGQPARLAYLVPQINRMLEEVAKETQAEFDYVSERFGHYLKESVDSLPDVVETSEAPGLEDIKKTDPMDRGEVPGAGRDEALDIPKEDLNQYTKTSCVRCSKEFGTKVATQVCFKCAKTLHKLAYGDDLAFTGDDMHEMYGDQGPDEDDMDVLDHMWDKDLVSRIDMLHKQIELTSDPEEQHELYAEVGMLQHRLDRQKTRSMNPDQIDDYYDQANPYEHAERGLRGGKIADNTLDVTGQGTGVADGTENLVQPTNPNMPFVCTICGHQGSRDEILAHVQRDHADVLQRQQQGQPQQQDLGQGGSPTGQGYMGKTADLPDDEDAAKVQPLPSSPTDQFDDYVQDLANRAAARQFSLLSNDLVHSLSSQLGVSEDEVKNNAKVVGIFGNYVGVNGEVGGDPSPPEGYEEVATPQQGQMDAREALVPTDLVVAKVADEMNLEHDLAYNQIRDSYDTDLPEKWHASVKGEQHVYLPTEIAGNQQPQQQQQQQQYNPQVGPTAPSAQQPAAQQNY